MNGIAINVNGEYKTYDVNSGVLMNCDDFVFDVGDDMFFAVPCNKVDKGDIIIASSGPACVIEATEKKDSDIVCEKKSNKEDKEDKEKNFSVGESMLRFLMEKFLYNEVIDEQLKGRSKNQTMKSFGATDDMTIEELAKQIIESSFEEL